jgi:asparagine synthetase B (glutamine-hydrolysing)
MCGISGSYGSAGKSVKSRIRAMMDAQTHRGPDAEGMFICRHLSGSILPEAF